MYTYYLSLVIWKNHNQHFNLFQLYEYGSFIATVVLHEAHMYHNFDLRKKGNISHIIQIYLCSIGCVNWPTFSMPRYKDQENVQHFKT